MVINQQHRVSPRRLLVADDDGHIREVLRYALSEAGYAIELAHDGTQAQKSFENSREHTPFDLVILDILMPGLDGLDVCRAIRTRSTVPIIFLSSRDEEIDRIIGLELGADDYVTKPFSPRELLARVKASLRRYDEIRRLEETHAEQEAEVSSLQLLIQGRLSLDKKRHECFVADHKVVLTVSEFALLQAFLELPDQVLTRGQLVEKAYGPGHFVSDRTVDSHIRRIRKKLKEAGFEGIETVYGVGYRMMEQPR